MGRAAGSARNNIQDILKSKPYSYGLPFRFISEIPYHISQICVSPSESSSPLLLWQCPWLSVLTVNANTLAAFAPQIGIAAQRGRDHFYACEIGWTIYSDSCFCFPIGAVWQIAVQDFRQQFARLPTNLFPRFHITSHK